MQTAIKPPAVNSSWMNEDCSLVAKVLEVTALDDDDEFPGFFSVIVEIKGEPIPFDMTCDEWQEFINENSLTTD